MGKRRCGRSALIALVAGSAVVAVGVRSLSPQPAEGAVRPSVRTPSNPCVTFTQANQKSKSISAASTLPTVKGLPEIAIDMSPLSGFTQTSAHCTGNETGVTAIGFGYAKDGHINEPPSVFISVIADGIEPSDFRLSHESQDLRNVSVGLDGVARKPSGAVAATEYSFGSAQSLVVHASEMDASVLLTNLKPRR